MWEEANEYNIAKGVRRRVLTYSNGWSGLDGELISSIAAQQTGLAVKYEY